LELESKFIFSYEILFAKIFSEAAFIPNNHRASHIFRDILKYGIPSGFATFASETANAVGKKASGSQNPLDAIVRKHHKQMIIAKAKNNLISNEFFNNEFPKAKKAMFPELFPTGNKNDKILIKVFKPNSFKIMFYLEVFRNVTKKHSNWFVQFIVNDAKMVGKIIKIDKLESEYKLTIVRLKILKYKIAKGRFFAVKDTKKQFNVSTDAILQVYGHLEFDSTTILFEITENFLNH